jgi:glycosyltransferase involved in cell wall biosynthesis
MKIVLVADGRSNITRSWIDCISGKGIEIDLVSTFPCEKPNGVNEMIVVPVAFSKFAGGQVSLNGDRTSQSGLRKILSGLRGILLNARYRLGPLTLSSYRKQYVKFIETMQPDVVHALRIPFEGMLASFTPAAFPLVISTWGNDLTLHARGSRRMAGWTRTALHRADGLMADASRDLSLAENWGYKTGRPTLMVPGNGGLHLATFQQMKEQLNCGTQCFNPHKYQVVNPRGFRPGSVHQDIFFKAIPAMLKEIPEIQFLCPAMQGQKEAERWVRELGIEQHVVLLPYLPQSELWYLYNSADIYISLSSHDGTPNTFLEALACGCFPVVGDIASLREWIEDGKTGMLVDALDEGQVSQAVISALRNKPLRENARALNWAILEKKAERSTVRAKVMAFYEKFYQ